VKKRNGIESPKRGESRPEKQGCLLAERLAVRPFGTKKAGNGATSSKRNKKGIGKREKFAQVPESCFTRAPTANSRSPELGENGIAEKPRKGVEQAEKKFEGNRKIYTCFNTKERARKGGLLGRTNLLWEGNGGREPILRGTWWEGGFLLKKDN